MIIQSKRVWLGGQYLPAQITLEGNRIVKVAAYNKEAAAMDYGEKAILPGFIDLHTHGAYGYDTNDGDPKGLSEWVRRIPQEGVTSLLPTTITQKPKVLRKAVANVAQVIEDGYQGAEILGIHLEGPYLDTHYKGVQPEDAIAVPEVDDFIRYQEAAKGWIKYITVSPEHDADYKLTRYCSEHGVVVSMGHSSATYEEAILAMANGATSVTHVYNGMTPLHHRSPGLVGAACRIQPLYGEIIGDGLHSHVAAIHLFFMAKGCDHGILVTDSLRAKHCPPGGEYLFGGQKITIGPDGLARLTGTDTIAGSMLAMNEGLGILIKEAGVSEEAAINACTINPARCLGVDDRKGKICAGYDADLVILDTDYSVIQTYCRGKAWL